MDSRFVIIPVSFPSNPCQIIYAAMHQDYHEDMVMSRKLPNEEKSGELIIKHLLAGGRMHAGPFEHPQIVLNVGYFPHSTVQQIRTHRVGISFDVQSFRYTGSRIIDVVQGKREVEDVFYIRPVDNYTDRTGKKYFYSQDWRNQNVSECYNACITYANNIARGMSEEHARGLIPFDVRQHFVFSLNVRTIMHLLDMRWKADAQLEAVQFCDLLFDVFVQWCPSVAEWYFKNRAKKAKLAP